ncbi:MAG: hypothetical protein LBB45_03210 [Methanobrevibacter sp.]|jgi:hypothetical protein|nr:hypothetical protein [Candidatus Methanovirga basalitermitum]
MKKNNKPHKILLNDNVLNFSVNVISDMLGLESGPNTKYNNKTIVHHLLNAATSQTSVSNVCPDVILKDPLSYKL